MNNKIYIKICKHASAQFCFLYSLVRIYIIRIFFAQCTNNLLFICPQCCVVVFHCCCCFSMVYSYMLLSCKRPVIKLIDNKALPIITTTTTTKNNNYNNTNNYNAIYFYFFCLKTKNKRNCMKIKTTPLPYVL